MLGTPKPLLTTVSRMQSLDKETEMLKVALEISENNNAYIRSLIETALNDLSDEKKKVVLKMLEEIDNMEFTIPDSEIGDQSIMMIPDE